jgi:succinate dehydrogenase / fumarate reductase iron-sulfur subunit
MCKTRLDDLDTSQPVVVHPIKSFPHVKDLVTDVKWNYEVNKRITPFTHRAQRRFHLLPGRRRPRAGVQEVHRVLPCARTSATFCATTKRTNRFVGPRFFVRIAGLEMHPMDTADRTEQLGSCDGVFMCNITKCCTVVCPGRNSHHRQRHHSPQGARDRPQGSVQRLLKGPLRKK